jgi:ribosome-associated protein
LQKLGMALADLSDARLQRLELPERLFDAVLQYRNTRSHEGRRRQLQYVGKLMREVDDAPLREAVAESKLGSARDTLMLHQAEAWRDALLADDAALTRWMQEHADCDAQRLRSLVRAARREAALPPEQRNPRSLRELFQFIRPLLAEGAA